jgi:2-haloacid dehalogenase
MQQLADIYIFTNRFKGAYCTVWEKEPCEDLFGKMEVMEDTFPAMARKIIGYSRASST